MNDIADGIDEHLKLFADDCIIHREIKCLHDQPLLNDSLNKVSDWFDN